jgi:hypothetical protein
MTIIRVIFDGKAFVPQQPLSLAPQSEVVVTLKETDSLVQDQLDAAIREYYQAGLKSSDLDDDAWAKATTPQSRSAWDED